MREITKNFSLEEFFESKTAKNKGINNETEHPSVINNIKEMCFQVLQPLRDKVGKPIHINSGYRCKALNELIGGSATSQHRLGQAVDIVVEDLSPFEVAKIVLELSLPYDQMILYDTFLHISISPRDRRMLLYNKSYKGERFD